MTALARSVEQSLRSAFRSWIAEAEEPFPAACSRVVSPWLGFLRLIQGAHFTTGGEQRQRRNGPPAQPILTGCCGHHPRRMPLKRCRS